MPLVDFRTMLALVYQEGGDLSLQKDYPVPVPGKDEALIRILRAGICSTVRQRTWCTDTTHTVNSQADARACDQAPAVCEYQPTLM